MLNKAYSQLLEDYRPDDQVFGSSADGESIGSVRSIYASSQPYPRSNTIIDHLHFYLLSTANLPVYQKHPPTHLCRQSAMHSRNHGSVNQDRGDYKTMVMHGSVFLDLVG
jgi:hypothetical protein